MERVEDLIDHLPELIPADVRGLLQALRDRGHRTWLVGGAIRDAILGLPPKDWDLATTAPPNELIRIFPHVVPVGIRHGTVQVRTAERGVEMTSLDAEVEESIFRDLARRDFTVNAMALSYPDGRFLDPHGGLRDIRSRILRGVLDARARFGEDPLRTLRAGRLVSTHGLHLDGETLRALAAESHGLISVAPERIREEIYRLLVGKHVGKGLTTLWVGGVWKTVLPELSGATAFSHAAAAVRHCPRRLRVRLSALLHGLGWIGKDLTAASGIPCPTFARQSAELAEAVLLRWRASGRDIREVAHIVAHQLSPEPPPRTEADLRRWMASCGADLVEDVLDLARAEEAAHLREPGATAGARASPSEGTQELIERISRLAHQNPPLTIEQLALSGEDVMRLLELRPGPLVGSLLRRLHDQVLEDPERNTPSALSEILMREYVVQHRGNLT